MSDRATVNLFFPTELEELARTVVDEPDDKYETSELLQYVYFDVKYGTLDFLDELTALGIPFDSEWDAGGSFHTGVSSVRFTPEGILICKEIYDYDHSISLSELAEYRFNFIELQKLITRREEYVTVLPWDNQVEYGRRYRTQQLIS